MHKVRSDGSDRADGADAAAVVLQGVANASDWRDMLREAREVLPRGGRVVLFDKGKPAELSKRLLCSGFHHIEHTAVGRKILSVANKSP